MARTERETDRTVDAPTNPATYGRGIRDAEKRWDDPPVFRSVALYSLAVIAIAALGLGIGALIGDVAAAVAPTVVLAAGAVGALWQAFRVWRAGGTWVVWQGGGWFLLTLTLMFSMGASAALLS